MKYVLALLPISRVQFVISIVIRCTAGLRGCGGANWCTCGPINSKSLKLGLQNTPFLKYSVCFGLLSSPMAMHLTICTLSFVTNCPFKIKKLWKFSFWVSTENLEKIHDCSLVCTFTKAKLNHPKTDEGYRSFEIYKHTNLLYRNIGTTRDCS